MIATLVMAARVAAARVLDVSDFVGSEDEEEQEGVAAPVPVGPPGEATHGAGLPALARQLLFRERLLGGAGGAEAVLFETASLGGADEARRAETAASLEALFAVLGHVARRDAAAQLLLLCERRRLHAAGFRPSGDVDDSLRRVHVKYVAPPTTVGEVPPVVELLAGLQNLRFCPSVVAVLDLHGLTRPAEGAGAPAATAASASWVSGCPPTGATPASSSHAAGGIAGAAPYGTYAGAGAAAQHFVLAASLLADAAAQLSATNRGQPCTALLWDEVPHTPGGSGSGAVVGTEGSSVQLGIVGSIFDAAWLVGPIDAAPQDCSRSHAAHALRVRPLVPLCAPALAPPGVAALHPSVNCGA